VPPAPPPPGSAPRQGCGSPPSPPAPPAPLLDSAAPVLRKLGVKREGRFLRVKLTASEAVTLRITVQGRGRKRTFSKQVQAGKRTVRLKVGKLRTGRYTISIRATDEAGNATTRQLRFRRR
jgi:hypothetical protein